MKKMSLKKKSNKVKTKYFKFLIFICLFVLSFYYSFNYMLKKENIKKKNM